MVLGVVPVAMIMANGLRGWKHAWITWQPKEDVTKIEVGVTKNIEVAVEKMKVWILSGVLGAVVVATSIAVAIIKIFSP